MAIKAVVEAGVGGPVSLTSASNGAATEFPDPRVTRLRIEGRPSDVGDLRITLWITLEFELDDAAIDDSTLVARELLDRVVDALAVSAGQEIRIFHWTESLFMPEGGQRVRLRPIGVVEQPITEFDVLPLISAKLTERHYRALRHLRHGLGHTSPERRFSSLMLAVMILARTFPDPPTRPRQCPSCGDVIGQQGPGERERLLNLAVILDGWKAEDIARLWELRNIVMGHGRRALTPEAARELLEAGFDAARLAYDCLNASLGLALQGPVPSWFITDLYMLLDSGDHAHETVVDVRVARDGNQWVAAWPATAPSEFRSVDPPTALIDARNHAIQSMKRGPRTSDGGEPELLRWRSLSDLYRPLRRSMQPLI